MAYKIRLRKKNPGGKPGAVVGEIGRYASQATAAREAQALADKRAFQPGVQITVETVGRKGTETPRTSGVRQGMGKRRSVARKANGKKARKGNSKRKRNNAAGSRLDLDPQQEVLYDTLKTYAENDGDSYPHAVTAVDKAWSTYRKERDANERGDFNYVRALLITALVRGDAGWKRTNGKKGGGKRKANKGLKRTAKRNGLYVRTPEGFVDVDFDGSFKQNPKLKAAGNRTILGHHVTGRKGSWTVHPYGKTFRDLVGVRSWLKRHIAEARR